jgi:putative intracellular protease/amidase
MCDRIGTRPIWTFANPPVQQILPQTGLKDRQVTNLTYHPASLLEAGGATPIDATVKRDGLIITGNGPGASLEFGEAIAAALKE